MAKILLKTCLKTKDETILKECLGIIKKNQIDYLENQIHVTILIQDNKIVLKRFNSEYQINMTFEKNVEHFGTYQIHGISSIPLKIITTELICRKDHFSVTYQLDLSGSEECQFTVTYEVIK